MPLTEKNLEAVINLCLAHHQRFSAIQDVATKLHDPVFYRSEDGDLAVGVLTDAQKHELEDIISRYLEESDTITATIRGLLAAAQATKSP